jgi:hypothetical protein
MKDKGRQDRKMPLWLPTSQESPVEALMKAALKK